VPFIVGKLKPDAATCKKSSFIECTPSAGCHEYFFSCGRVSSSKVNRSCNYRKSIIARAFRS